MSNVKKTQKEWFNEILGMLDSQEHKDFIQDRIDALAKKSASKKATEKQTKNAELANAIYDYMEEGVLYTITDIMKEVPELQEIDPLSNQYVTNLVTSLKDSGRVERVVEKGRAKFSKVVVEGV